MDKELTEKLQHFLWYGTKGTPTAEKIVEWFDKEGYVVIRRDDLTKVTGLIATAKLLGEE